MAGALLPTLGFGIAWNAGLLRAVDVRAPDGLVCTALPPAPVGSATVETVWVVSNVVSAALNRLLECSPTYRHRAQAVCSGTMATFNLGGDQPVRRTLRAAPDGSAGRRLRRVRQP